MDSSASKSELRTQMLARLRALPELYVQCCSVRLLNWLRPWTYSPIPRRIFLYAPLPHEVHLLSLLREFSQHAFYFPRCLAEHRLSFHRVAHPKRELVPGPMNIPTPLPHLPKLSPTKADLLLVPGLAFTREGDRLGYGGGYYDRLLASLPSHVPTVALAFPEQILPSLPTEAHDVRVQSVLTMQE